MGESYYLVNLNLHLDYSWLIHQGTTIYFLNLLNPNRFLSSPSDFPELMWRWMITSACYSSSNVRQIILKRSCQHSISIEDWKILCCTQNVIFCSWEIHFRYFSHLDASRSEPAGHTFSCCGLMQLFRHEEQYWESNENP